MSDIFNRNKKLLEGKIDLYNNFLDGAKKISKIVPVVQEAKEKTEWTLDLLNDPSGVALKVFEDSDVEAIQSADFDVWDKNLPKITVNPEYISTSGSAASGTASEIVFTKLVNIYENSEEPVVVSLEPFIGEYAQLQAKYGNPNEIIKNLGNISVKLSNEFEQANQSYMRANNGLLQANEAAICMRNVLEHLNGELLELARKIENRQIGKNQQWLFISEKLAVGEIGSLEYRMLASKSESNKAIWQELTNLSKNLVDDPLQKLKVVYSKWIDHLFTSLKLIDFNKIRKD
jgi:hypothetical protein